MAGVTQRQLTQLGRYLDGDRPNDLGEWGMYCPIHDDSKRSASLNIETGLWFCNACNIGGAVDELIGMMGKGRQSVNGNGNAASFLDFEPEDMKQTGKPPSEGAIKGWQAALWDKPEELEELMDYRSLTEETLQQFEIGYDREQSAYTIPIRNADGTINNVRFYQIHPSDDRRKIWSVKGLGRPALYPISQLDGASEIILCEGEWDALLTIQNGFAAITRTGAAKVWNRSWNVHFDDKLVIVCHDMDEAGQLANKKVVNDLKKHAREVRVVELPYKVTEKHGKDLTDYWQDGYTPVQFKQLIQDGEAVVRDPNLVQHEVADISVLDSFDARQAGQRMRMRVTITGKHNPSFMVPKEISYACTQDAGVKCQICPMNELGGHSVRMVDAHDPVVLRMIESTHLQMDDTMRNHIGAQKCNRLDMEVIEHRTVEKLHVRPSVEYSSRWNEAGDYTNRGIISVGRHDSQPNNTVEIVGTIFPNPKTQHNEFQAWELIPTETSVDKFELTPKMLKDLGVFKVKSGERPIVKLADIAKDLASHVTKIYGRNVMHALFDLVWHSALSFRFKDEEVKRGWLDVLVVGDTRTGKSEAADKIRAYYQAGEMLSCESATFAGIVGGLQQYANREWEVSWGAVPLNDRRLVVMDEISGLATDQIAQMSSIRSSGEAQLTKIRSERTWARTRLLWLGNPRAGRMTDYTYGVQAIRPLIGNNEDIARFDLAMSVAATDVDREEINRSHHTDRKQQYPKELCQALVQWVWSRTMDQVLWDAGAEDEIYKASIDLGSRYVEDPPLIQAANVRIKLARVAVALAARTFSTDRSGECIVVKKVHVQDAVKFIDKVYQMPGFGYHEVSREQIEDFKAAISMRDDAKGYLVSQVGLSKFLRSMAGGRFRRQDLEDILMLERDTAVLIINSLWKYRLIRREGANIKMQPILHELLREVKD